MSDLAYPAGFTSRWSYAASTSPLPLPAINRYCLGK